jgi:hypothetical protein
MQGVTVGVIGCPRQRLSARSQMLKMQRRAGSMLVPADNATMSTSHTGGEGGGYDTGRNEVVS